MSKPRLVVFDVDGTLVDSQRTIVDAMRRAFETVAVDMPTREAMLGIVGLSIDVAMARLAPDAPRETHHALADAYKSAYFDLRRNEGTKATSPFYPDARETLMEFAARDDLLLGVATGKSRRGLDKLIEGHGLEGVFVTEQVADFHPSKPHPSMLNAALDDTGTEPQDAVMIGDTSYDMDMARAAGMRAIGVSWGYHSPTALTAADRIIHGFKDLSGALDDIWRQDA